MLAIGGLLGAKLYALSERDFSWHIVVSDVTHGYRYPGAVIGLAIVLLVFRRQLCRGISLAALGDALTPAVGVGAALLRLGCLGFGCCFGTPSRLPWAVTFPARSPAWFAQVDAGLISRHATASLPVHPLQLYFMLLSLAATGIAFWLEPRKAYAGQVVLVFLTLDQLGKFALEYLRQEPLPAVQIASLVMGVGAATMLVVAAVRTSSAHAGQAATCS